jgi:hypothetical protein
MSGTIILATYGYSAGGTFADLRSYAEAGAVIVDTRLKPFSRWRPDMNLGHLKQELGIDAYLSLPDFGNENFKKDGPIRIRDFDAGLQQLQASVQRLKPSAVVLLCACSDPLICHRSEVAARLIDAGFAEEVVHLKPGSRLGIHPMSLWDDR